MPQTEKTIRGYWYISNNVGDNMNYFLLRELSKKQVICSVDKSEPHYIVCGSILSQANERSTVWGAGFSWEHHRQADLYGCKNVIAVRGELSAQRTGMDIQHIGDPALLMPILYPTISTPIERRIGIIPHWTNILKAVEKYQGYHIINPLQPVKEFIDEIVRCECIFSESLHGLILSDAYGVPNAWLDMGAKIDDPFKYHDYYSTTDIPQRKPLQELNLDNCFVHKYKYDINSFLNSCPFLWT